MKLLPLHPKLVGHWTGESRLWLDPAQPPLVSPSTLSVAAVANGRFLSLDYTWAYEDRPQHGLLLAGDHNERSQATAAWVDSFHQSGKVMHCEGAVEDGTLRVTGHYAAPPGPDWGWRLSVHVSVDGELSLEMHNLMPGGEAELAVRGRYRRG